MYKRQAEDCTTVAISAVLIGRADLDPDVAYTIVYTLFQNADKILSLIHIFPLLFFRFVRVRRYAGRYSLPCPAFRPHFFGACPKKRDVYKRQFTDSAGQAAR